MGYYTHFTLAPEKLPTEVTDVITADWDANKAVIVREATKWYDYDPFMRKLSAQFPDITFTLFGEGEEAGDLWKAYYLGGKGYRSPARIVWDDFDPGRLA